MTQMKSISSLTHEAEKSFSTSFLKKFFLQNQVIFMNLFPLMYTLFQTERQIFFHPKSLPPNDTMTRLYYTTSFKCSKDKNVLQFCHQYNQCNCKSIFNPLTLTSDQDGISPYNINPISSRQVTRIKKAIN